MIAKIEAYRKSHGRLPSSIEDVGVEKKLEGPIYYQKQSETDYIVWYGKGLGESVWYESATKEWK